MKNSNLRLLLAIVILSFVEFLSPTFLIGIRMEEFRVAIENRENGTISVSRDLGKTWLPIGLVIRPNNGQTKETDGEGFTAANWAPDGSIAATAVNAIHVKVNQGEKYAVLFTIQPKEFLEKTSEEVKSYFSSPTSIFSDIPAGKLLFGAEYSPRVGNPVFVKREGKEVRIFPDFKPMLGDVIIIPSICPEIELKELRFENRKGGFIFASFNDGSAKTMGVVEKPVGAVGRFGGSQYAERGKVRANHPGVLCIATSKQGLQGGFQIVPIVHAKEPCLDYIWSDVPAWMIIKPLFPAFQHLEGCPPIFSGSIQPQTGRCEVRIDNGSWQLVPELSGLVKDGLKHVTEIRIRF
ncbi:MAG: hypothetical protein HQM08_03955 [Candidatus Riflebacteria bacterium]|nr:hypothetical protein [Candidatus Riflebacteria bacterium]